MRILRRSTRSGNALLVTLVMAGIIGFALASYLTLVRSQHTSIVRSQSWNTAIPVLEAGIEEAITHIYHNGITNLGANGWVLLDGHYTKSRELGDSFYTVEIIPTDPPEIIAQAFVPTPFGGNALQFALLGAIGLNVEKQTTHFTTRKVAVTTRREGLWTRGMVARGRIDLYGNRVETDSFDSADPNHSTNGLYDPAKRKDNGDIATNSSVVDSLSTWNADIRGRVATGPGGRVRVGPQGKVGSIAWHADPTKTGIQPGWFSDDMNVYFREISPPYSGGMTPTSGTVDETTYRYLLEGNQYIMGELKMSGWDTLYVAKDSTLYITGDLQLTGNARIVIAEDARLTLYMGGDADVGGNGMVNRTGNALNFVYFGLPTSKSLKLAGNANFVGVIYAPEAHLALVGGGTSTLFDFVGASVTSTVTMNGNFTFHYDENIGRSGWLRGYIINSWLEI